MVNEELIQEYSNAVRRLKKQCLDAGISEGEFKKLYFESLNSLEKSRNVQSSSNRWFKRIVLIAILCIMFSTILFYYKTLYSCIACSLQDYIYPGLRLLRKLSIPVISLFPSLSAFYHETCLIQNPFFTVVDMDCWPCSNVNSIREIYEPKPVSGQNNAPFIYQTEQHVISIGDLKKLYQKHQELFDKDAPKILAGTKTYIKTKEMFAQHQSGIKQYYIWKFNNMDVAKVLRQVIPRPKVVPIFGQSTERFLIVDTSQDTFQVPDTECSFSFLLSLNGDRTIHLVPAEECRHECKTLKVELQETYLLWYNWWYWRPVIQPSNGNTTFIGHVGSYC